MPHFNKPYLKPQINTSFLIYLKYRLRVGIDEMIIEWMHDAKTK